jgi:hypothetical protein
MEGDGRRTGWKVKIKGGIGENGREERGRSGLQSPKPKILAMSLVKN